MKQRTSGPRGLFQARNHEGKSCLDIAAEKHDVHMQERVGRFVAWGFLLVGLVVCYLKNHPKDLPEGQNDENLTSIHEIQRTTKKPEDLRWKITFKSPIEPRFLTPRVTPVFCARRFTSLSRPFWSAWLRRCKTPLQAAESARSLPFGSAKLLVEKKNKKKQAKSIYNIIILYLSILYIYNMKTKLWDTRSFAPLLLAFDWPFFCLFVVNGSKKPLAHRPARW